MSVNEIVSELTTGDLSFRQICQIYNISMAELQDIIDFMIDMESDPFEPRYDDSMDGDFDSAMASAGFGTDEDYGYYGDEY